MQEKLYKRGRDRKQNHTDCETEPIQSAHEFTYSEYNGFLLATCDIYLSLLSRPASGYFFVNVALRKRQLDFLKFYCASFFI